MRIQLYNLEEDLQELNDVSFQNQEIVQKMESIFKQEHIPAEIEKFNMNQLNN